MNTVIISSHVLLEGAAHALRDHLIKKNTKKILFIQLPLVDQRTSYSTIYVNGKKNTESHLRRGINFGLVDYALDFLWVIFFGYKFGKAQLFVGIDPLNAVIGIFLKKIGRVKKVIYYGIDFVPIRFENKMLNYLFHLLEAYCVRNADEVWNVSDRIKEGRFEYLGLDPVLYPQKTVPIGIYSKNRIVSKKTNRIVFIGHLLKKQGVQEVLRAVPLIVKKIPNFRFVVVGGGEYLSTLEILSKKLNIEKYIDFKGWIKDKSLLDSILSQCDIAIACYEPEKEKLRNFTYYADPTKIKDYLNSSLPVILTEVPTNAAEIAQKEFGIIVIYNKEDISNAIV